MDVTGLIPQNDRGRFYHIDCGPGDLAPYILTCGDPFRAQKIARKLDKVLLTRKNREFLTYTGSYKDIPVSIMATGIGAPATAIAIVEAANCINPVTFLRLGTCGALPGHIAPGELVITESSWREENTTQAYAAADLIPQADAGIVAALKTAAAALKMPHHVGMTCTTADFYAGQGRVAPGFPTLEPQKISRLRELGVLNLEMEMSTYLTLAAVSHYRLRAGGACLVVANRTTGAGIFQTQALRQAENRLIAVGLQTLEILAAKDKI